jgi:hypothetical protein
LTRCWVERGWGERSEAYRSRRQAANGREWLNRATFDGSENKGFPTYRVCSNGKAPVADRQPVFEGLIVQSSRQESSMTQQVSPLRQRMIDDMTIRNMSPLTHKAYIRAVTNFSPHFMKSPDKLILLSRSSVWRFAAGIGAPKAVTDAKVAGRAPWRGVRRPHKVISRKHDWA